jgi:hypothetical protein
LGARKKCVRLGRATFREDSVASRELLRPRTHTHGSWDRTAERGSRRAALLAIFPWKIPVGPSDGEMQGKKSARG